MLAPSRKNIARTALLCALFTVTAPTGFTNGAGDPSATSSEEPGPPALAAQPQENDDLDFRVYWKNSLNFETKNKQFKFKLGGRLQNDWWFIANESDGLKSELAGRTPAAEQASGTAFRRARVHMSGTMNKNMHFKWAYDFGGGTPDFKDAYIGWKGVPGLGTVRVGQQKEPIGLEFAYSSNSATFIERGLPHYMNPERSTGVRFNRTIADDSLYLTAGAYRPSDTQGNSGLAGDSYAFSGRAAWSPIFEDKGERLLLLGVNGSFRTGLDTYRKKGKPQADEMARYIEASVSDVDNVVIAGLEAAANFGPLSIQSEYVLNSISRNTGGTANWSGWYTYLSWFMTGEHRPYRRDRGAFTAMTPDKTYGPNGGGAWELALRYSALDLGDSNNTTATNGGRLSDITAGINWYMNYNMRVMLNYDHAKLKGIGNSDTVLLRFQVFF